MTSKIWDEACEWCKGYEDTTLTRCACMKVRIEEYYDGFAIYVGSKRFSFDQEDTKEDLKKVFQLLGHEVEYEEVY